MTISGNLRDVAVTDLLQFIGLGRRTGVLALRQGGEEGKVAFLRGQITAAQLDGMPGLTETLVARGILSPETLKAALCQRSMSTAGRSLGQILLTTGALAEDQLAAALSSQIKEVLTRLLGWEEGAFEFFRDAQLTLDGLVNDPRQPPTVHLDPEGLLLELVHHLDESRFQRVGNAGPAAISRLPPAASAPPAGPEATEAAAAPDLFGSLEIAAELGLEPSRPSGSSQKEPPIQVLSSDTRLVDRLRLLLPHTNGDLRLVRRVEAGTALPGEDPPIVLVDLRYPGEDPAVLARIRRTRPRATVAALVDGASAASAYKAGAVAAIPDDSAALASSLENLRRERGHASFRAQVEGEMRSGLARLRRIMVDLRSGLLSATVALNLMHVLAEAVERALLYLVQGDHLTAVGAFGFAADGGPLTEAKGASRVPLDEPGALVEATRDARARCLRWDDAALPADLTRWLGRPRSGEVLVLPVVGTDQVIAVLYADNGHLDRPLDDLEFLEVATAQMGIAFENELLRRHGFRTF